MNCEQFQAVLDDFLAGTLADDSAAREHLKGCRGCRELVGLIRNDLVFSPVAAPEGLAEAVLRQTSGSVCESARESIPDYAERELPACDTELIELHLEGCSDCRNLTGAVRMLAVDLPAMAEAEPGPGFAAQVLAATSEKQTLAQFLAGSWKAMVQRPRIAFEAAYLVVAGFVLVFGLPFTGDGAGQMLEIAQMQPIQTVFAADGPLAGMVRGTVEYTERVGSGTARGAKETVVERAEGVTGWLRAYRDTVKQRWSPDPNGTDQPKNENEQEEIEP